MTDPITDALAAAQTETIAHLWTPSDAIAFTPAVLSHAFGDGRALFRFTTINNRPRWWVIRGCSSWTESNDAHDGLVPVHDHADEIVQAIADQFGGLPNMLGETEDVEYVDDEGRPFDPADIVHPQIDDRTGASWGHLDWPDLAGVTLAHHPVEAVRRLGIRILAD
jgi:hypothetical protein